MIRQYKTNKIILLLMNDKKTADTANCLCIQNIFDCILIF